MGSQASDASMSRAELVDAWRERRRARRTQSDDGAAGSSGPDGFALRRWRRAGVFGADAVQRVERLLSDLVGTTPGEGEEPDWALGTLRQCLDGDPVAQLPSAVRALLEHRTVDDTATAMTVIHACGLPWLTPHGQVRLEHLLGSGPDLLPREGRPSTFEDGSGAFALQYALRHDELTVLPRLVQDRVLPWAPLGTVDDLIDAGAVTRDDLPWERRSDPWERSYLRARLAPELVNRQTAEAIGWQQYLLRVRFLDGQDTESEEGELHDLLQRAAEGDTSVLKQLEYTLPRTLVLRLRHIKDGALTGNWEPDILADRGLWRLMSALWEPKAAVQPRRSAFHALAALRHAYDCICAGDLKRARAQVNRFLDDEDGDPLQYAEALNMSAYLALLDEDLNTALIALTRVAATQQAAEPNFALLKLRQATPRNDRPHPSNPYLELGLPNQSAVWKQRYRDLRREFVDDREEAARLNRAMRRIQQAEQQEDWSDFFVLPLDATVFQFPDDPPVTLVPPVEPMPRQTASYSSDDAETVRRRAVADLLPTLLNAPRRPDHQHRTTS
ncbi:hypothetical protein G3I32_09900 [Streptomyces coelicoflavus]|uniref:Uncharacterized protein n=1 Tax=Streptomyces coelicoflavus TaxID=285562 RepID=A0A7K3PIG7_9ACTN|nr:hypothetical protein [Streptomyces coelicoflavus]NEB09181.1 hypothetical protein [Streptomyces coelicoflavus]